VPAIDKQFDYLVPQSLLADVHVGAAVRIPLSGRRVGGWVTEIGVEPAAGRALRPIAKVSGLGPSPELIDLARWAAWRWAGRPAAFLRTAAAPGVVRHLPPPPPSPAGSRAAAEPNRTVLRLPPAADRYRLVAETAADGPALVLCPSVDQARRLGQRLRRDGHAVAVLAADRPGRAAASEWAAAAAGANVVGTRAAAWAPVAGLRRVVVLDEHDEAYQEESSPTWHARDVVAERARRAGVPCTLVSPCPTLEALGWGELHTVDRAAERRGWPRLEVVDRRGEDPGRAGLFSSALVEVVRGPGRVLCVLNRRGRARLLACATCGDLLRCTECGASVEQLDDDRLRCRRADHERPAVCRRCGGTRLRNLRLGVVRAREELEALAGEPVVEVTAATRSEPLTEARVYIGTEAVLHQVPRADAVAFLDLDQELTATRYRAAEQALALLARAGRVVRGRGGVVLVQTRMPDHRVIAAALHADPTRVSDDEARLRGAIGYPPATAMAVVAGAAAPDLVAALPSPPGLDVLGPADGRYLLRAPDHQVLCDALAATPRPSGRLRLEVDPLRI
jgi:primosomal protein N' (replication factor Y)